MFTLLLSALLIIVTMGMAWRLVTSVIENKSPWLIIWYVVEFISFIILFVNLI